jgi:hypothetical protein
VSITFYEPPPTPADEERRARAVEDSRAIEAAGDPVLDDIAIEARDRLQADMSVVSIIQGDYQHLIAASGLPLGIYSRRTSFCGHAVASGEALYCIPDLTADRRFAFNPWVTGESGDNRFYAAAVLRDDQGLALGALCVLDETPRDGLSPAESATLARLAGGVIERLETLRDG